MIRTFVINTVSTVRTTKYVHFLANALVLFTTILTTVAAPFQKIIGSASFFVHALNIHFIEGVRFSLHNFESSFHNFFVKGIFVFAGISTAAVFCVAHPHLPEALALVAQAVALAPALCSCAIVNCLYHVFAFLWVHFKFSFSRLDGSWIDIGAYDFVVFKHFCVLILLRE
jgi:hypothetical protein